MPGLRTLALTVAVRGGAKWETEATSGWSHCLEHLVFKGAGDMGAREIVERIEAEVAFARRLFADHDIPVIDVTRRSIEETAAAIINLHQARLEKQA